MLYNPVDAERNPAVQSPEIKTTQTRTGRDDIYGNVFIQVV